MPRLTISQLEGGADLRAWFEEEPTFHDATLRELELRQGAPGKLVIETFQMQSERDEKGYFTLTQHVVVTFTLFNLIAVELSDFMEAAIIFDLSIDRDEKGTTLRFNSSYGVNGWIKAERIVVSFEPVVEDQLSA